MRDKWIRSIDNVFLGFQRGEWEFIIVGEIRTFSLGSCYPHYYFPAWKGKGAKTFWITISIKASVESKRQGQVRAMESHPIWQKSGKDARQKRKRAYYSWEAIL